MSVSRLFLFLDAIMLVGACSIEKKEVISEPVYQFIIRSDKGLCAISAHILVLENGKGIN